MKNDPAITLTAVPVFYEKSLEHLLAGLAIVDLRMRWAVARARAQGLDANDEFRGLYVSDKHVDKLLGYTFGQHLWMRSQNGESSHTAAYPDWTAWTQIISQAQQDWQARTRVSRRENVPLRLDDLAQAFALNAAEIDILLIALAPDLDPRYERFYAYLQDDVTRKRPSIDLILNLLTDSAIEKLKLRHLFAGNGRLQQSRLIHIVADNNIREPSLLAYTVRPSANVVEQLLGQNSISSRLGKTVNLWVASKPQGLRRITPGFKQQLIAVNHDHNGQFPLFAFNGAYGVGKFEAAQHLAAASEQPLLSADIAELAELDIGLYEGLALLLRDGRLLKATIFLTNWDTILHAESPPQVILQALLNYPHTVVIAGNSAWQPQNFANRRPIFVVSFQNPDYEQRLRIWQTNVKQPNLALEQISNHFRFTPGQIEDAAATANDMALQCQETLNETHLFSASRAHSNQRLATLANKIQPRYRWSDIVLPIDTLKQLKEMVNTVHHRPIVYEQWGFEQKLALGKGLNVLFAGESGTGKTMAADIMANALGLDLYKIDLSRLVSKYIGETEKNLNRIFTEARTSNAILFFDEADAIFGKRSEVKDSHDRHANVEISYLLQRMETYDGIVILATNLRANLDEAFTRRMHFITEFPFPEASDRERIWRVNFPPATPISPTVDFQLLAQRFRLAGGNIRNIILAAAFLAANTTDKIVAMDHLFHATRREYQKMGRLIDETLFESNGGLR